jgi:hypothetical protein
VEKERKPWWLYLNLLGLDAPLIAVIWLFLFARTWRVDYHPWQAYVTLGLAMWTLRVAMKLLQGSVDSEEASFVMKHRKRLKAAASVSGVFAVILTVMFFPLSVYAYLFVWGLFITGYFALSHFSEQEGNEISYGKHVLGGLAFAYGVTLEAYVFLPGLQLDEFMFNFAENFLPRQISFMFSREFLCFALFCILASSATELWARSATPSADGEAGALDEMALSLPLTLLGAAALVFAVQDDLMGTRPFYYAILTGAALLQILNRTRWRFPPDTVRALTMLCFLVPGIVFKSYPPLH